MNILPVWKRGITGKGVVVSILDDGEFMSIIFHLILLFVLKLDEFSSLRK